MAAMPTGETPRRRLERLMEERRADLGLTWEEVADRAGLTREGLRRARIGSGNLRALTKRGIERALAWSPGSVDNILRGGDPVSLEVLGPGPESPADDPFPRLEQVLETMSLEELVEANVRLAQRIIDRQKERERREDDHEQGAGSRGQ